MQIEGKRFLVTGGNGFLGKWVIQELCNEGVFSITFPHSSRYDLRRQLDVKTLHEELNPKIVIHLAANVGGIGANQENPGSFCYDNLIMGALMIEGARKHGVEKFVSVSTVCSYPEHTRIPFKEEDIWNGYPEPTNAPYGLAKKMLIVLSQGYRKQYGLNAINLIPANLYGPGDNFEPESSHVIPAIIKKCFDAYLKNKDSIKLWGTGCARREFLYVEDAARALVIAIKNYDKPEPVNIGNGRSLSINHLTDIIIEKISTFFNGKKLNVFWDHNKPDGQLKRQVDVTRAKEMGFTASVGLDEGLDRTIEWYRNNYVI